MNTFNNFYHLSLNAPRVPLTDTQHKDYRTLVAKAQILYTLGHRDEARRLTHLASDILRTGAPACE